MKANKQSFGPPPVLSPNRLRTANSFGDGTGVLANPWKGVNNMDITTEFKKGYKTSEFWVTIAAVLAPPIALFTGYELDIEGVTTLLGSVFGAITYAGSRTWLKRKRIDGATASS